MGNIQENQIYLEESDIVNNFDRVFGYPCPYFGKILYLFLSGGQHRMKIDLLKMIKALWPLYDKDNQMNQNKIAFQILDIDRDDSLNILNLLDLQKNLSPQTPLGQEIFKIMQYQVNNLHDKSSNRKSQKINYDVFCKVVGRSCIIEELRENIFGTWLESKDTKQVAPPGTRKVIGLPKKKVEDEVFERSPSIFKPDESLRFDYDYYFEDVKLMDDCSYGQRNYERNLDALLAVLLKKKEKPTGKKKEEA